MSEETLQEALVAAQQEMVNPKRSKTAKVKGMTKDNKAYEMSYSYATLDDTMDAALKALNKHGIALLQPMVTLDDGRIGVRTVILGHGEQLDLGTIASRANDDPQKNGSIITYYRRYGLGALGLVAEDDDDGARGRIKDADEPKTDPTKEELGRLVALAKVNGTNDAMKAWFTDHGVPATVTGFKALTPDALSGLHAVVAPVIPDGVCPTCSGAGTLDGEPCQWCSGTGRA